MNHHDDFLKRIEKAVKLAGQALIDNADKLVVKVDENLGVNSVVISITLPTLTDSYDECPTIEVSTTYIPRDAVMALTGIEEGEF